MIKWKVGTDDEWESRDGVEVAAARADAQPLLSREPPLPILGAIERPCAYTLWGQNGKGTNYAGDRRTSCAVLGKAEDVCLTPFCN